VGGSRTAPTRQQTLRATLDWSHGLLSAAAQTVFQRLAAFSGSWSCLVVGALLVASLFNAGVTNGTAGVEDTAATGIRPWLDLAQFGESGIHEGSNRSRYVQFGNCDLIFVQALYAGQNTWVRQMVRQCADVLP